MTTTTTRAQRSRAKGWRKPANAIICDRTSRYGNPHKVAELGRDEAIWRFRVDFNRKSAAEQNAILDALEGKVLLCYCAPDEACHCDVYIEMIEQRAAFRARLTRRTAGL